MRRTTAIALGLTAIGGVVVTMAGPARAVDTAASTSSTPLTTAQVALQHWRTSLEGTVESAPATFTGLSIDPISGSYIVAVAPGADLRAAAATVTSATTSGSLSLLTTGMATPQVRYTVAGRSHDQQMTLMAKITDAVSAHAAGADGVVSWGPDPATGDVHIGILASATSRGSQIAALFGPGVTVDVVGKPELASRVADSSPWYGGDRIYNSGGGACSTGFGAKSGSTYYELTAGHCGAIGTPWRVGTSYASGTTLGSTSKRSDSNNGNDVAAITASGSAAGRMWSSCLTCSSSMAIKGQINAVVGEALCFSGSVSQFVCGTNVTSVDDCVYFPDQGLTHCGLTEANNSNGTAISQPGDSGGPVIYNLGSGNAYAAGTIVGYLGGFSSGIYDPLKYDLPALGLSLVTG